jgi:hypothetical protein
MEAGDKRERTRIWKSFEQAVKLFKSFHEKRPGPGKIVGIAQESRIEALEVGQFYGIAYIADGKKYFHKFNRNNRPLVFVSSDGRQIYILKGGYKFTDRGFIG